MRLLALTALILMVGSTPAMGELYEWEDEKGRIHWTDDLTRVPTRYRTDTIERTVPEGRIQLYEGAAKPAPEPEPSPTPQKHRIRIEQAGLEIVVGARLNHRLTAAFKVDTGAMVNTIPRSVVERLGLTIEKGGRRMVVSGISGQPMVVPVVTLASVNVGGATVERVDAAVLDTMNVGLLGMPFFRNFRVDINPSTGLMTLEDVDLSGIAGLYGGYPESYWRTSFGSVGSQLRSIEKYRRKIPKTYQDLHAELDDAERYWNAEADRLEIEASRAGVPRAWRE